MLTYVLLVVGFLLLIKGADVFVEGSSSVAKLLKVPSVIIGLTVVAFGTSMPEASVSITAAIEGANELAVSNVIGSNIFNLLIVTGICAIIKPMRVKDSILKKEFPFSILITCVLLFCSLDVLIKGNPVNSLSKFDGIVLLAFFVLFFTFTIRTALISRKSNITEGDSNEDYKVLSPLQSGIFIICGIAGIIFGGNLVVKSASEIAATFGLSQTLIGLTIVSVGTSLPELVTSVVAAKKGESDISIGNVIGSNIFNILLILGASSAIHPIAVNNFTIYDTIILGIVSIIGFLFALGKKTINRIEGLLMVLMYCGFMAFIIIR